MWNKSGGSTKVEAGGRRCLRCVRCAIRCVCVVGEGGGGRGEAVRLRPKVAICGVR